MNSPLHERIASDGYWNSPSIPMQPRPSMAIAVGNLLLGAGTAQIRSVYNKAQRDGTFHLPLTYGHDIPLSTPGMVVKIIEDQRLHPKKGELEPFEPSELDDFNAEAADMSRELRYKGLPIEANVETPNGVVAISRHVLYLTQPILGDWHIGMSGIFLDGFTRGMSTHQQPRPVGHIVKGETRKHYEEKRVVSAQLLGPKKKLKRPIGDSVIHFLQPPDTLPGMA